MIDQLMMTELEVFFKSVATEILGVTVDYYSAGPHKGEPTNNKREREFRCLKTTYVIVWPCRNCKKSNNNPCEKYHFEEVSLCKTCTVKSTLPKLSHTGNLELNRSTYISTFLTNITNKLITFGLNLI